MSIATQLSRILGLRNRISTKLVSLGLVSAQADGNPLADCTTAIESIGGTKNMTNTATQDVAGYQYAKVSDSNLIPGNIVSGVSILGVVGTASVSPPAARLQERTVLYGGENAPNTLVPSSGYDGISKVNFELTDASPKLTPGNIRNGVKIMGVTGTYGQLQTKNVALGAAMPSTVSPATGYTGLSQVTFTKDTSVVKADNIKNGVQILGVTGSYETPTESKSVLLGADYPPAAVTPSAGKHLSSVTFSMNSNLFKAENIKAGVTLLGVTGNIKTVCAELKSTGPADGPWNFSRSSVTINLDSSIDSINDVLCYYMYNIETEEHVLESFVGKVQSICYINGQHDIFTVELVHDSTTGQNNILLAKDTSLRLDFSVNGNYGLSWSLYNGGSSSDLFMGRYRVLVCYRNSIA